MTHQFGSLVHGTAPTVISIAAYVYLHTVVKSLFKQAEIHIYNSMLHPQQLPPLDFVDIQTLIELLLR